MGFTDVNELDFTADELNQLEKEMKKYKVPILYKIVFGSLYKWGKWFIPIIFLVIFALMIIYSVTPSYAYDFWPLIKGMVFAVIFGIGGLVLISFLWQRIKVLRWCKRLKITLNEWNILAIAFQIKYI